MTGFHDRLTAPQGVSPASVTRRPTIGFLTGNIHIGAGRILWPGVLDAAEQADVNLICYPGGGLAAAAPLEAQRNAIYDLVDPERVAGLVSWSSTVGGALPADQVVAFHRRYAPLPIVRPLVLAKAVQEAACRVSVPAETVVAPV